MWIYATDTYITKHKKTFEAIQKVSSLPIITELLSYLVMHLGEVRNDGYDDTKDILSPHYNSKRKRLLRK